MAVEKRKKNEDFKSDKDIIKMSSFKNISYDTNFGLTEIPFIGDLKVADLNAFIKITS